MPLNNNLGRPRTINKFKSLHDYLENYIFKIKDSLFVFEKDAHEKKKIFERAVAKATLQRMKLERAYEGLEQWRK